MKTLARTIDINDLNLPLSQTQTLVCIPELTLLNEVSDTVTTRGTGSEIYDGSINEVVDRHNWFPVEGVSDEAIQISRDQYYEKNEEIYKYYLAIRQDYKPLMEAIVNMTHGPLEEPITADYQNDAGVQWCSLIIYSTMSQAAAWGDSGLEYLAEQYGMGYDEQGDPVFLWAQLINDLPDYSGLERTSFRPDVLSYRTEQDELNQNHIVFQSGELFQVGDPLNGDKRGTVLTQEEMMAAWNLTPIN